jgi:hypothetical protein
MYNKEWRHWQYCRFHHTQVMANSHTIDRHWRYTEKEKEKEINALHAYIILKPAIPLPMLLLFLPPSSLFHTHLSPLLHQHHHRHPFLLSHVMANKLLILAAVVLVALVGISYASDVELTKGLIKSSPVVVFSKSYCPYDPRSQSHNRDTTVLCYTSACD